MREMRITYVMFELWAAWELLAHLNKRTWTQFRLIGISQPFGQPNNMDPRCAYINPSTATFAQMVLHVMQLLISYLSSSLTSITAS